MKGRSTGVHRVAALQSWTMISRSTNRYRLSGESVTGRAGTRTSRLWSELAIARTVEATPPDNRKALSTCSRLTSDVEPPTCVRDGAASRRMNSTACSSTKKGWWSARSADGESAGRSCHQSTAPTPTAAPITKARKATAWLRHRAGTLGKNAGREGPTRSVSGGGCTQGSSGLPTRRRYPAALSRTTNGSACGYFPVCGSPDRERSVQSLGESDDP